MWRVRPGQKGGRSFTHDFHTSKLKLLEKDGRGKLPNQTSRKKTLEERRHQKKFDVQT